MFEIIIGLTGFVMTILLSIIAFFITKYLTASEVRITNLELKNDERHASILKQISQIESVTKEHSVIIKSNKEVLESSINSLKEQIREIKLFIEQGFAELHKELKDKK